MMLLLRLAVRNVRRNPRRALLTAATVLVGSALLVVSMTWIQGGLGSVLEFVATEAGHVRVVDAGWAAREEMAPLYENITEVDGLCATLRGLPGVVGAEPRIVTGALVSKGEEIGEDYATVVGASDAWYREFLHGPDHVVAGTWLTGAPREVVLGRWVARQQGIAVGDEVLLMGQTQYGSLSPLLARVVGIVGANGLVDQQAFVSLEDARWVVDLPGGALEVLVYGSSHDPADLAPIVDAVRALPAFADPAAPGALVATPWFERDPWAALVGVGDVMQTVLDLVIGFMAALAIFNTMTVSVLERTAEVGVLRALGIGRADAVGLFLVEAALIGLLGGLCGAVLGSAGGLVLTLHGVHLGEGLSQELSSSFPIASTVYGDLRWSMPVVAVALGVVMALVGALLPSLRAAVIRPVAALRTRR